MIFDKSWFKEHQTSLLKFLNFKLFGIYPFRYFFRNSSVWKVQKRIRYFGPSWINWDDDRIENGKVYRTSQFFSGPIHAVTLARWFFLFNKLKWPMRIGQQWYSVPVFGVAPLTVSTFEPVAGANSPVDGKVGKNE